MICGDGDENAEKQQFSEQGIENLFNGTELYIL